MRVTKVNALFLLLTFGIIFFVNEQGWFGVHTYLYKARPDNPDSQHEVINHPHGTLQQPTSSNPTQQQEQQHQPSPRPTSPKKGRILITGGMGNIGTALVKQFLFEEERVVSLDLLPMDQVPATFTTEDLRGQLEVVHGDIRNATLLNSIFSSGNIRGVVHLAAITRDASCHMAPIYCRDVNVGGTETLLKVMSHLPRATYPSLPWVVYASSLQVKNRHLVNSTMDPLIHAMADAEQVLWRYKAGNAQPDFPGRHVRSIVLRLGHVYGGFDAECRARLIPRLVRNALNQLPLYYYINPHEGQSDLRNRYEFLHIDDALAAIGLARKALDTREDRFSRDGRSDSAAASAAATTTPATPHASSPSPTATASDTATHISEEDWEAAGEFDVAGGELVHINDIIRMLLNFTASTSKVVPLQVTKAAPAGVSREALDGPAPYIAADLEKSKKWLGFVPKTTFREGLSFYVEDIEHRTLFYLEERTKIYCLLTLPDTPGRFKRPDFQENETWRVETHVLHEKNREHYLRVQQRMLELTASDSDCSHTFKSLGIDGMRTDMVDPPICRNNNGTRPIVQTSFCDQLMGAQQFVVTGWTRNDWLNETCGNDAKPYQLPACEYDCEHPTICIRTGRCKCVDMGRCSEERYQNPSLYVIAAEIEQRNPAPAPGKLTPMLMTWLGRHLPTAYPKINVLSLPPAPGENLGPCKDSWNTTINNNTCFGATERVLETLAQLQVPPHEADTHLIPFYHACSSSVSRYYSMAISQFKQRNALPKSLLWVMVHDWSKCEAFRWTVGDLRRAGLDRPAPPLDSPTAQPPSFVLQTNGDTNTNCYNPAVDVVIPPQGCHTSKLLRVPTLSLRNMAQREIDVLHLSTPMGTGGLLRLLLNCPELYEEGEVSALSSWKDRELQVTLGRRKPRKEYISLLGNSRFCLCPRGVAGWSPRVFDAIAMGCIPVLISDYTVYPFQDLLDYTKFAIFVREVDLPVLADILRAIPLERLEEMQFALRIVRDSLLYNGDRPLLETATPIDLALRSLALQMQRREYDKPSLATHHGVLR